MGIGHMVNFSANLGFLWQELSLNEAIREAKKTGFEAVEFHWPYAIPANDLKITLLETGLSALGMNTIRGDISKGENGLSALVSRKLDARKAIDQAIEYGAHINVKNIHVMAGVADGREAHKTFIDNLAYATDCAAKENITILIEPLNHYDAPDYFLNHSDQAVAIIKDVGQPNLKLMYDCYHMQIMEGDITRRLETLMPYIGHIQIAGVPQRGEPDMSELDYKYVLKELDKMGYVGPIGVEYKPTVDMTKSLNWMKEFIC